MPPRAVYFCFSSLFKVSTSLRIDGLTTELVKREALSQNLYTVCYILTTATERFLSYPLVSLFRQVLQPLLQHDPEHFQELIYLYKISLCVSVSIQTTHSYLIVILHVPETLVSKETCFLLHGFHLPHLL
ncbi:hypothetical protein F2Q68_00039751 [Brassica cretica]|uniref:Uncharacterized protein n=1 Tax=Brassica cretica TaxID=69181 RepID=A0A8S9MGF1_BRACR|nr:hypothetical protein F2Q68_00039751 [Brassica cretica]